MASLMMMMEQDLHIQKRIWHAGAETRIEIAMPQRSQLPSDLAGTEMNAYEYVMNLKL